VPEVAESTMTEEFLSMQIAALLSIEEISPMEVPPNFETMKDRFISYLLLT
jgi:hypothetical protein